MDIILFILFITVIFIIGYLDERNHYRSIEKREQQYAHIPVYNDPLSATTETYASRDIKHVTLVRGSVVIGADYSKMLLANLKSLFGGNMTMLESFSNRARREATLRMIESATHADLISNVKFETVDLGFNQIEVIAYGTAIYLNKM